MGFTPNEIRNQEFSKSMRGFSPAEVEAFKEAAASALEEAKGEILKLTEERNSVKDKYEQLRNIEETLKNVVIEAQKNTEQTIQNAKKEAELIVSEARNRRDEAIEDKHRQIADLDARIHEVEYTRRSFYSRLKAEIEAHLRLLEQVYIPRREKNPTPAENPVQQQPSEEQTGELAPQPAQGPPKNEEDNIDRIVDQFRQEGGPGEEQ